MPERCEITDLIRVLDADGAARPVELAGVVARLEASGQRRAARIARRLPADEGRLSPADGDALVLRVHCELQRLGEELQQGRRVAELLADRIARLHREDGPGHPAPVTVIDIGCGIGYLLRWLAAYGGLGPVRLIGVDRDAALVGRATELAAAEGLAVEFVVGDAFGPSTWDADPARSIMISTGLLHHLRGPELPRFFADQAGRGVRGFAHWDPAPSRWSVLGAWMFHRGRMREPVSRHDGVESVRRAHPASTLLAAAAVTGYEVTCPADPVRGPVLVEVLRPVTGWRR